MKTSKAFALKLFAVVLSILLVFGAFPVSALDATEYVETETVSEESLPKQRRTMSFRRRRILPARRRSAQ